GDSRTTVSSVISPALEKYGSPTELQFPPWETNTSPTTPFEWGPVTRHADVAPATHRSPPRCNGTPRRVIATSTSCSSSPRRTRSLPTFPSVERNNSTVASPAWTVSITSHVDGPHRGAVALGDPLESRRDPESAPEDRCHHARANAAIMTSTHSMTVSSTGQPVRLSSIELMLVLGRHARHAHAGHRVDTTESNGGTPHHVIRLSSCTRQLRPS